jgi:hypothetical protein
MIVRLNVQAVDALYFGSLVYTYIWLIYVWSYLGTRNINSVFNFEREEVLMDYTRKDQRKTMVYIMFCYREKKCHTWGEVEDN